MITEEQQKRYHDLLKEQKKISRKARKRVKKYMRIQILWGGFIGLSIVFMALFMALSRNQEKEVFKTYVYAGIAFFLIGCVLHVLIHEAGHFIFGLLTDYEFLSFRIFSMMIYRKNGKLHLRKYSLKGTSGQCLMYPPKKDRHGAYPYVLYNLGGGICNFFFSVPALLVCFATQNPLVRISSYGFLIAGVLVGFMNLIPLNAVIQNDGMNVKSMKNHPDMEDALYLQLKVNAELSDGKRITEYNKEELELPGYAEKTNLLIASVRLLAYNRELALHNYEEAEHMLCSMEEALEEYSMPILNSLRMERLFFSILNHQPAEEIAALLKSNAIVLKQQKTNFVVMRVIYCLEGVLSEEEKKDIISLIVQKANKKRKKNKSQASLESIYQHFLKKAAVYPNEGEAAMHVSIMEGIQPFIRTPESV